MGLRIVFLSKKHTFTPLFRLQNQLQMRINFNLKPANDYCQLYLVIRHNGTTRKQYSQFNLQKDQWDNNRQQVRTTHPQYSIINAYMADQRQKFAKYVDDCVRARREPSIQDVLAFLSGGVLFHTAQYLTDAIQLNIEKIKISAKDRTIRSYKMLKDQIGAYEKHIKKQVLLQDVDESFALRFVKYLINEQNNSNNTIDRKLVAIKTVMRYASKKGLVSGMAWDFDITLKKTEANRTPLSEHERLSLWNYRTLDRYAKDVLDAFLLSMYTGLRFSDLKQLKPVHFKTLPSGEHYISFTQQKGDKKHSVAVPDYIYDHIKPRITGKDEIFALGFNNEANRQIKKIAKEVGLNREMEIVTKQGANTSRKDSVLHKQISFHFARYTYTNILLTVGSDTLFIQKNLNHSNLQTTSVYARRDDTQRISDTCSRMII